MEQFLIDRFWVDVDKSAGPEGCWPWTASTRGAGYGQVGIGGGRQGYAHRFSYEIHRGPIPDGLVIDHICHNGACVNPTHLQAVTPGQNLENFSGPTRRNKSGVRGVHWSQGRRKWQAVVRHKGKAHHVGYFTDLAEAEAAVIAKRNELHTNNLLDRKATHV